MRKLIKKNLISLISFELIFSSIIYFGLTPILKLLFKGSLKVASIPYLSQENMMKLLYNPLSVIIILIIIFIVSFITMFEIYAINVVYIYAHDDRDLNLLTLIAVTFKKMKGLLKISNLFLFIYISLFIPFVGGIYKNPIFKNFDIPNFILDSIYQNTTQLILLIVFITLFTVFVLLNIYTFVYMFNKKYGFFKGFIDSLKLIKKSFKKILWKGAIFAISALILMGISVLMQYIFALFLNIFKNKVYYFIFSTVLLSINLIITSFIYLVIKIGSIYIINNIYYKYNEIPIIKEKEHKSFKLNKLIYSAIALGILLLSFLGALFTDLYNNNFTVSVMAHRGSSVEFVENSKEAFLKAMEQKAKYIELDVTLTKDNEVVITHDLNIKRQTGYDKNVRDLTLSEIKEYDFYSQDKSMKAKIITLKELMPLVNMNTILNVELKPGHNDETNLAIETEKILKDYPRHMICSLKKKALIEVKKINPNRLTGFIMAVAIGNYKELSFADFFSIEETFVSESSVKSIHSLGKKIFVWTVNNKDDVDKYYDMGVDGIITDLPLVIGKAINESMYSYKARKIQKLLEVK